MSGAWKLRAVLYGSLAAVAVLVLLARSSAGGSDPAQVDTYTGYAAGGARITIVMEGRRFSSLSLRGLWRCHGRRTALTWTPRAGQGNVRISQRGSELTVHERPDRRFAHSPGAGVNVYMRGNLNRDGHRIDGVIAYVGMRLRGGCTTIPLRFGVSA
jgi:hypothetical protein